VPDFSLSDDDRARLVAALEDARALGFLGPGPVEEHLDHGVAMGSVVPPDASVRRAVDLGTGGGVPGLVLALGWADVAFRFVEAQRRRAAFLASAATALGIDARVRVDERRAEVVGRDPLVRGSADLVTARSFGRPAVTAECAAPLLRPGGLLVVSEPPEPESDRWPADELAGLGLEPEPVVAAGRRFVRLVAVRPCPAAFPRRTGLPPRRPLF
jgi:16S rRNA (guanine527-N7)-methyltransferase